MAGKRKQISFQDNLRSKILAAFVEDKHQDCANPDVVSEKDVFSTSTHSYSKKNQPNMLSVELIHKNNKLSPKVSDSTAQAQILPCTHVHTKDNTNVNTNNNKVGTNVATAMSSDVRMKVRDNVSQNQNTFNQTLVVTDGLQYGLRTVATNTHDSFLSNPQQILSRQQLAVFRYLMFISETTSDTTGQIIQHGYSNARIISNNTGIPFRTCQDILKKLTIVGLIKKNNFQKANWKGFYFIVLKNNIQNEYGYAYGGMDIVTQERMDAKVPFSSSSLNTLLTTTKGNNEDLTQIVENSPEMGYWHIEPNIITNKQFQIWLTEFNLTPDILITYLDRCRFDMVELGKETDLKKGSAANWFYGVMKKRGGSYPEPSGYKSIKELKLEEEKKILEKNERITKEAYELKLRQDFSTIFKDPTSKEYQACLEIMCTDKNLFVPDKNGVAFQEIMWLTYKALREEGKIHDS